MKLLKLLVLLSLLVFAGCIACKVDYGDPWRATGLVHSIPVIGVVTEEENCALAYTYRALANVKAKYPRWHNIKMNDLKPVMFIRTIEDKTPEICKSCLFGLYDKDCANRWIDLPKVIGIPESRPGNGYGGLSLPHIMINRTPERSNMTDLLGLLSHEYGCHECAGIYEHNEDCKTIDRLVRNEARRLMSFNPNCAIYLD